MAKWGEHAAPRCPVCGRRVRIKPGTRRDVTPLWQCREGVITHPDDCEWTNGMLAVGLAEGDDNAD